MVNTILVVVVMVLFLGCSRQSNDDARKAELIREIGAIQEDIYRKQDLTSLFTTETPKHPEHLEQMNTQELESVRASLQEINASLDVVYDKLKGPNVGMGVQGNSVMEKSIK